MTASSRTRKQGPRQSNKARNSDRESAVAPTPRAASPAPAPGDYVVKLPPKNNVQRAPVCTEEVQKKERVAEETPVARTSSPTSSKSKSVPLEAQNEKPAAPVKPKGSEEVAGSTTSSDKPSGSTFSAFGRPAYKTLAIRNEDCRNFKISPSRCRLGSRCPRVHPRPVQDSGSASQSAVVEDLTQQPKEEEVVRQSTSTASQPKVSEVKAASEPQSQTQPEAQTQAGVDSKPEAVPDSSIKPIPPFMAFGRPAYKTLALRNEDCPRFKTSPSLCGYGSSCSRVHPRAVQASGSTSQSAAAEDLIQQSKEEGALRQGTSTASQPEIPKVKAASEPESQPQPEAGVKSSNEPIEPPFLAFGRPAYKTVAKRNEDCRNFKISPTRCRFGSNCPRVHPMTVQDFISSFQTRVVEGLTGQPEEENVVQEDESSASQPEVSEVKVPSESEVASEQKGQPEPEGELKSQDPDLFSDSQQSTMPSTKPMPQPFMPFGRPALRTLAKINEDCHNFKCGRCRFESRCYKVHPILPKLPTPRSQFLVEDKSNQLGDEQAVQAPSAPQLEVLKIKAAPVEAQPEPLVRPPGEPEPEPPNKPISSPFTAFGRPAYQTLARRNEDCQWFMDGECLKGERCMKVHPKEEPSTPTSRVVEDQMKQSKEDISTASQPEVREAEAVPKLPGRPDPPNPEYTDSHQPTPHSSNPIPPPFLPFGRPAHPTTPKYDEDCWLFLRGRCPYGIRCNRVHPLLSNTPAPRFRTRVVEDCQLQSKNERNKEVDKGEESSAREDTPTISQLVPTVEPEVESGAEDEDSDLCDDSFLFGSAPTSPAPPVKEFEHMSQVSSEHPSEGTLTESPRSSLSHFETYTGTSSSATSPPPSVIDSSTITSIQTRRSSSLAVVRPYCRNWMLNRCFNRKCYFYHGDIQYNPPMQGVHPRPRFMAICPHWEAGRCMRNWLCDFVHGDLKYDEIDWIDPWSGRPQAASLPSRSIGELARLDPSEREQKPPRPPYAPIICRKWLNNECPHLWSCKYVHEDIQYEPPVMGRKYPFPASDDICPDPQCSKGYGCDLIHEDLDYSDCMSESELPPVLVSRPSIVRYRDPPLGQRPRPPCEKACPLHAQGQCSRRYRCKYLHLELEYDPPVPDERPKPKPRPPLYSPVVCKPWFLNQCPHRWDCKYVHDDIEYDPPVLDSKYMIPPSKELCTDTQCNKGFACRYTHPELDYSNCLSEDPHISHAKIESGERGSSGAGYKDPPPGRRAKPCVAAESKEDPPVGRRPLPVITETCVKWLRDECPLRYECRFRHGDLDYDPLFPPGLAPPPGLEKNVSAQKSSRPPWTLRVRDHAKVKIASGFQVLEITTGFETPWVFIHNIPTDVGADDVAKLVGKYGEVLDIKFTSQDRISTTKVKFSTSAEALEACTQLNGIKAFGVTISAKLPVSSAMKSTTIFQDTSVRIRWEAPSQTAYCGFSTMAQAEKAIQSAKTPFRDNCVQGNIHQGIPVVGIVTVRFRGIPLDTKEGDMERFNHPEDIVWAQPNYKDFHGSVNGIRRVLTGDLQPLDFNVLPPPYRYGGIAQAWAHFSTPAEADAACRKLNGWKPLFTGKTRITAQHVKSLTFSLSPLVYDTIQNDVRALKRTVDRSRRTAMTVFQRSPKSPFMVKLAGDDLKELGQLKAEFESILNWETLKSGARDAYDAFFANDFGKAFLHTLRRENPGVRIWNDTSRHTIQLRGSSFARRRVKEQILSKIAELKSRKVRTIPLEGPLFGVFVCKFRDELCQEVGQDNIAVDNLNRSLRVRGDNSVFVIAQESVRKAKLSLKGTENRRYVTQCPVCLDEVTQPVLLPCGHSWCHGCLVRYLLAALETKSFPLNCLGKEGQCGEPIPLIIARSHLSQSDFDALVDAAFGNYVHCHQEEFRYCPTPDCSQIYRPGAPETVLQCPSCLLRICPNCHIEAHDGFDCPEKDGGHTMFKEWVKNHNVKPCPGCNVPIERAEGCNHMTCTMCKTHICWVCMETFPGGKGIYDHMRSVHGGIGLPDPLQEYMQQGY